MWSKPIYVAPRSPAREQRFRVDLAEPADEMLVRVVDGRSVDRRPRGILLTPDVALRSLELRKALLRRRALRIPLAHGWRLA